MSWLTENPMALNTPNSHELSLTFAVNEIVRMKKQSTTAIAATILKNPKRAVDVFAVLFSKSFTFAILVREKRELINRV